MWLRGALACGLLLGACGSGTSGTADAGALPDAPEAAPDAAEVDAFAGPTHTLTVEVQGDGTGFVTSTPPGLACPPDCSAAFPDGSSVTLTAAPGSAATFGSWAGDCSGSATDCVLVLDVDHAAQASFNAGATITVTRSGTGGGEVRSLPLGIDCGAVCTHRFQAHQMVTLTAFVDGQSQFTGWSGDCAGLGQQCVLTTDAARTVDANFTELQAPTFVRTWGGPEQDTSIRLAVGASDSITMVGGFSGSTTIGAVTINAHGQFDSDVVVARFGAAGVPIWVKGLGGSGGAGDSSTDLALTATGDVVVTGSFVGNIDFGQGPIASNGRDGFVAVLDGSSGAIRWGRVLGGPGDLDNAASVEVIGTNIYVGGRFSVGANFGGGLVPASGGDAAYLVAYAAADGAFQWVAPLPGRSTIDIMTLSGGDLVVAGYVDTGVTWDGVVFPGGMALARLSGSDGSFVWARPLVAGVVTFRDASVTGSGDIVVLGDFRTYFEDGSGGMLTPAGETDALIARFAAADGDILWARALGGSGYETAGQLLLDGNDLLVSTSFSGLLPLDAGATLVSLGTNDLALLHLDVATGLVTASRRLGGPNADLAGGLARQSDGTLIVGGAFETSIDLGSGPIVSQAYLDAYLVGFAP